MRESAAVGTRGSSVRWAVLGAYALLAACTQLLWLTFAAVDTRSAAVMKVDLGAGRVVVADWLVQAEDA